MRSRGNKGGTCDPYILTLVRRAPKARVMVTLWYNRGEEVEEQVSHPDLSIRLSSMDRLDRMAAVIGRVHLLLTSFVDELVCT